MAALCATCGAKKAHSVHLRAVGGAQYHPYADASKGGLKPKSDGRVEYEKSAAHKEAYALPAGATDCWPAAFGAPKECDGPITPSHTLSRSKAGGLEAADKYPVPPACVRHNAGLQDDPEIRAWGEVTFFTIGNKQFPFLVTDAYLQAEREARI